MPLKPSSRVTGSGNDAPHRDARETREVEEDTRPSDETSLIQIAFSVIRPYDFYVPNRHEEEPLSMHSRWEKFPSAMVITYGGFNDISINSAKKKLDELADAAPIQAVSFEKVKGRSELITFYLKEFPGGSPNSNIPLLLRARMANFDVHHVLIN